MHQLISLGAVRNLPDELQWSIRMLLPRQGDSIKSATSESAQKTAESAFSQMVPSSAYLPYMLQPQQMAMLTQHAQQASQPYCIQYQSWSGVGLVQLLQYCDPIVLLSALLTYH